MEIMETIKQQVEGAPVVLYMKGTPQFPMCGFSARVVQILNEVGAEYNAYNVLEQPELRANLPKYANWPTFPQLYIKGELVGGCDITIAMFENGELETMVKQALAS
ncbi:glutaredoxin [Candidatus Tenderia electrophaga]|jgi:monothiol glutaredoxin|uniref:Glutaredoxin n=1 Tax=Candidatus Tenderia electrophaga TaxID=1748243 RepID=A0A0S2TG09_9GAMM|nr:glutaredoxin [Candidatus Tenderia electrophaga]